MQESELDRLAKEELLREAKNAKHRTETFGATGWQACPLPKTNKRFLHNILVATKSKSDSKKRCLKETDIVNDEKCLSTNKKGKFSKSCDNRSQEKEHEKHFHSKKRRFRDHHQKTESRKSKTNAQSDSKRSRSQISGTDNNSLTANKSNELDDYPQHKHRKKK